MRKILKNNYFLVIIYILFAFLAFGKLSHTFFQQDEWAIFGTYLYFDKINLGWFERLFTYGQNTHTIPLSGLVSYFEYKLFGLNFSSYAYFSVAIHLLNTYLVFYLAYLFFKKKLPAFMAGLVFLVDSISSQAITWIATTTSTANATLFTSLSLIFMAKFLMYGNKKKFIVLSLICLFISLLFKESSIFMFLFVFIFWLMFSYGKNYYTRALRFLITLSFVGALYTLPRLFLMLLNSSAVSVGDRLTQPSIPVYLYRTITFPVKIISQSVILDKITYFLSDKLLLLGYPNFVQNGIPDVHISQTIGADAITYIFTAILLLICFLFYKFAKNNKMGVQANIIVISVIFIGLSSLPLILIPGSSGYFSFFDGRYLYLSSIFKSILFADIFLVIYQFFRKKEIIFFLTILFFVFFTAFNLVIIRKNIGNEVRQGDVRQSILTQIQKTYPKLPEKIVFYTQSDSSYYGLPIDDKILPFLSGFGQVLLVWYEGHGQGFPACFFRDKYLYAIVEQGYKECEGRGYGYFRKFDSLKKAVNQYGIDVKNIIAFKFISNEERLEDISTEIRKELAR